MKSLSLVSLLHSLFSLVVRACTLPVAASSANARPDTKHLSYRLINAEVAILFFLPSLPSLSLSLSSRALSLPCRSRSRPRLRSLARSLSLSRALSSNCFPLVFIISLFIISLDHY